LTRPLLSVMHVYDAREAEPVLPPGMEPQEPPVPVPEQEPPVVQAAEALQPD